MNNTDYWAGRMKTMQGAIQDGAYKEAMNLEAEFNRAISDIEKTTRAWYQRFADNNSISYAEAQKWLTGKDLDEFKWTVEEYIKYGKENALSGQWVKQLENASSRVHISRLESLKLDLQQQAESLGVKVQQNHETATNYAYTQSYNHTAFEVQSGLGYGWTMQSVDAGRMQKVMSRAWTADGKTFSKRLWDNQNNLITSVNTQLTQMIIRGEAPDKAIAAIAKKFNVSKKQAGRLVMTESAAMASTAQKDCFTDLDVEMYIDVATLDSETCPICSDLDGRTFKMSEYVVGETAPPWHPWCRCCTAPYYPDMEGLGTRASRDPLTGKTVHKVPRDMKYKEWEEKFLKTTPPQTPPTTATALPTPTSYFSEVIKQNGITDQNYSQSLQDRFSQGAVEAQKAFEKYVPLDAVADGKYKGSAHYNPLTKRVSMNYAADAVNDRGAGVTYFHEHGHLIDMLGTTPVSYAQSFTDALQNDFNSFIMGIKKSTGISAKKDLYNAISSNIYGLNSTNKNAFSSVSDILNGMSAHNNSKYLIKGGWGHSSKYWKQSSYCVNLEAFAHFYEAQFDPTRLANLQAFFPAASAEFIKLLKGLI